MERVVIEERKLLDNPTPMMKQYLEVKEEYADYILLYRLGDFYECFFEDAITASRELELTLTGRECGEGKRAAMCGVPFHKADIYIARLADRGIKVAVCEQVEDPKSAVGLVKREVTRVITPGTITDSSILPDGKNNFLTSICFGEGIIGVSTVDITTGEISATCLSGEDRMLLLKNDLGSISPSEIIINTPKSECPELCAFISERLHAFVTDNRGAV